MSMKFKPRTLAIAVVGILAGSGIAVLGSGMLQAQPESSSVGNASGYQQGHTQENSPAQSVGAAPVALRGSGVPMPASSAVKRAAEARAQALLRQEKIRIASAAGKTADEESLSAERYTPRDVVVEVDGSEHVRMDRTYLGLPVIGGGIVVHARNGELLSSTRTLDLQVPDASHASSKPTPTLSQDRAIVAASKHFNGDLLRDPTTREVYYAKGNRPMLAYEVALNGTRDGIPANSLVYIDANTGSYLDQDAKVYTLSAATGQAFTLNRGSVSIATTQVAATESANGTPGFVMIDQSRNGSKVIDVGNKQVNALEINLQTDSPEVREALKKIKKAKFLGIHLALGPFDEKNFGTPFFDDDNKWETARST